MIPFEDLCAALDAYKARQAGQAGADPPTAQVRMPDVKPVLRPQGGEEEGTLADGMQVVYDDKSNELDIGDVLSDEEEGKDRF